MSTSLRFRVILSNVLLFLSFAATTLTIYGEVNRWSRMNVASVWGPVFITPYRIPDTPQVEMPINPLLNAPFILFLLVLAVNLYYITTVPKRKPMFLVCPNCGGKKVTCDTETGVCVCAKCGYVFPPVWRDYIQKG